MTTAILSVYQNFPSTAAILVGNRIVAAAHEERFSRLKNDERHPAASIEYCLSAADMSATALDAVVLASHEMSYEQAYYRTATWSIEDYLREQRERWYPWLVEGKPRRTMGEVFPDKRDASVFPPGWVEATEGLGGSNAAFASIRKQLFADWLGIPIQRVRTVEHHRSHAYYSYYASPFRGEPVLAITLDGWGDGLNFTMGVFDEAGRYRRISESANCAIARIYRYMTLALGMKPNEHEYKVMGLAPYGESNRGLEVYELFKDTLQVSGVDFVWNTKPSDAYYWFKERLEGYRFDAVAYGLQRWVEDLVLDIVRVSIAATHVRKVVLSGGVAMNIKAMGRLVELPELEALFVGGTPSDDTLALGAAFCAAEDLRNESGQSWDSAEVYPLRSMYLGPEVSDEDETAAVRQLQDAGFLVHEDPSAGTTAGVLARGKILGRCVGRMEVGQRALGNRSLLADPTFPGVKERINAAIKHRDFWMPFAPIVMDTYADQYLVGVGKAHCDYMSIGVETTALGYEAMIAACHPADRSARPQVLRESTNPDLYRLLAAFEGLTGRGALLNTSFNLHGWPIVRTAVEAADVLKRTELDGLILPRHLITRD